MNRETFTITVKPARGNYQAPVERRLARLLKAMLRGYGFRCVDIRPHQHKENDDGGATTKQH